MKCKYKNSCLNCIDCERVDFAKCKYFLAYNMEELKNENGSLFFEKQPELFDENENLKSEG
ncbi:MAG TPA: hypothetical protein VMV36_05935 [Ignavibacteriaceae bacterium]|nr:hypothetical protein [Ignavibacteriaceae bacterium]